MHCSDIEVRLREQWSGLFREYLTRRSQQQLLELSAQVTELRAISNTMRRYLEAIVPQVDKQKGELLVNAEKKRLIDYNRFMTERNILSD